MSDAGRFSRDVVWNIASVGVLGVCGVAMNMIIGRYYGPETFGVFSQVLAVYFVLSQLAAGGFVFSALSLVGRNADDSEQAGHAVTAALVLTSLLALAVAVLAYGGAGLIARFFDSPDVTRGVRWVAPGLWFFALNKVLLFSINALRHMRAYAIFNAGRFVLILGGVIALTVFQVEGPVLPAVFTAAECILFPSLLVYFYSRHTFAPLQSLRAWGREHLRFGGRTFFSSLLLDTNTRVDVIMLGYFTADKTVGVYAFASLLAEGFYQIVVAVQTNVTPILSRLRVEGRFDDVRPMVHKAILILCPAMAGLGLVATLIFPVITQFLTSDADLASGWTYFAVIMAGIAIGSSYLPFGFILNQWGHPATFMVFVALLFSTNLALNALLIPHYAALGAALATAAAFALTVVYLKVLTRVATGVSI